jgi:O-antigen/teichoic acid export membrane protein
MQRNIVTAFVSVVSGHLLGTLVAVVTAPLIVRLLGPSQYGVYATLAAIFGFIMIVPKSGIHDGLRKFLAEERSFPDWKDSVFGFYFRLATLLTVVIAALFVLLPATPVVERVLSPTYERYIPLLALWAFVNQYSNYFRNSLMGLKLEHISEPLKLLQKVAFGVCAVALAYLGYGITGIIASHLLAGALVIVASVLVLRNRLSFDRLRRRTDSGFPMRELTYFNALTVVYILLLRSLAHVDVVMLEYFTTSAKVGYYKAALILVEFLWFVPVSIQRTMLQSTSELWRRDEQGQIELLATRLTRYTLLFTTLLALGLAVLAPTVVPLYYGAEFTPTVLPLLVLIPGTVGFAVARPMLAISQAKGQMRLMILATGVTATLNLGLNLVLIPPYGMVGAALATTVGYGSLPFVHALAARKLGYHPLSDLRLGRFAVTAAVGGGTIFAVYALVDSPLLALVLVPPVGFAVYWLAALKTRAVDPEELLTIVEKLPGRVGETATKLRHYL